MNFLGNLGVTLGALLVNTIGPMFGARITVARPTKARDVNAGNALTHTYADDPAHTNVDAFIVDVAIAQKKGISGIHPKATAVVIIPRTASGNVIVAGNDAIKALTGAYATMNFIALTEGVFDAAGIRTLVSVIRDEKGEVT